MWHGVSHQGVSCDLWALYWFLKNIILFKHIQGQVQYRQQYRTHCPWFWQSDEVSQSGAKQMKIEKCLPTSVSSSPWTSGRAERGRLVDELQAGITGLLYPGSLKRSTGISSNVCYHGSSLVHGNRSHMSWYWCYCAHCSSALNWTSRGQVVGCAQIIVDWMFNNWYLVYRRVCPFLQNSMVAFRLGLPWIYIYALINIYVGRIEFWRYWPWTGTSF